MQKSSRGFINMSRIEGIFRFPKQNPIRHTYVLASSPQFFVSNSPLSDDVISKLSAAFLCFSGSCSMSLGRSPLGLWSLSSSSLPTSSIMILFNGFCNEQPCKSFLDMTFQKKFLQFQTEPSNVICIFRIAVFLSCTLLIVTTHFWWIHIFSNYQTCIGHMDFIR